MNLVTDKGPCSVELRTTCIIIACFMLSITGLTLLLHPSYLFTLKMLIGFLVIIVGNLSLLYGALQSNEWLVLVWLFNALLFFIGWPIAVLGVIFNFGGFRQESPFNNIFLILLNYIITLLLYVYCTRIVYSFFQQRRNAKSSPQHVVIV